MTRGKKKVASVDVWEDGHVDVYMGTFPGSDKLTNKDWEWIWPIRNEVANSFEVMIRDACKHG